jgi:cytochrome P450
MTAAVNDNRLMVGHHFRDGQPHAEWRALRHSSPIHWTQPEGFRPYWSVTRHAHILEVEQHPDIFLNAPRFMIMDATFESYMAEHFGDINRLLKLLVQMDAPEHSQHRRLLQPWFSRKNSELSNKSLEALCHRYFDELAAAGDEGNLDFSRGMAFRYPLRVACRLLGTPEEDDLDILALSEEVLSFQAPKSGEKSGFEKMLTYCQELAEDRRRSPRDDLATFLVQATINGKPLQLQELLAHFLIVATAGHDTAATAIMGGVKALIEHPDQWRLLRREPTFIPTAVEEILRWVSPNLQFGRTAARDYEIGGQFIRAGDSLALVFPSANRDEAVFTKPDCFDITRAPNPHLAFGSGPHSCLGSHLARMELRCFLKTFLERVEDIELTGPVSWQPNNVVCRFEQMPVRYRLYPRPLNRTK